MTESTEHLREALLALSPSGASGFEGLLAVMLSAITESPFRLAASGSQRGFDGQAAHENDRVCFEGKRYDGDIPRTEVLTKIGDLTIDDRGDVDLWVLGATVPVRTQLVNDARALAARIGVSVLVLDWSTTGLPPLAVALAMAEGPVASFLEEHVQDKAILANARAALKRLRADPALAPHSSRLKAQILDPSAGAAVARDINERWFSEALGNKRRARIALGQPLCPGDPASDALDRPALVGRVTGFLSGIPDGKVIAVLGGEGFGKSWLVGQSWLSLREKPLMLFLTAEDFASNPPTSEYLFILVRKLIVQTGGQLSRESESRWLRKLVRWRTAPTPDTPRLVVVIDGLNQRPAVDWAKVIDGISYELERIGGRLMVTARSPYYSARVKRRVDADVTEVDVPEWTEPERDLILNTRNIKGAELQPAVAKSLRNPRLLGIALEQLRSAQIKALQELTVSRLMFEHIRAHERDAPVHRPAYEFAGHLENHAKEIRTRLASQQRDDVGVFDADLQAVADGRFFRPVPGDPSRYTITEEGLPLALGFALVDELRKALSSDRDLSETFETTIEPLAALDQTADIVLSALTIACLNDECPSAIGIALVDAFARLQNPSADMFPAFASFAPKRPDLFMAAAKHISLSSAHVPCFDWVQGALFAAKKNDEAWATMTPMLVEWLSTLSLVPAQWFRSHLSPDERRRKEEYIEERVQALSPSERALLDSLPRNDEGDLGALARLAMTLIAGRPVAPFAKALRNWAFAQAINPELHPFQEFGHLVCLNRTDWERTREATHLEAMEFDKEDSSPSGKWARVRLLLATGHSDDAAKAESLVRELRGDQKAPDASRPLEEHCQTDPCDPASERPSNIAATAQRYREINPAQLRLGSSSSVLDHFFTDARTGLARFEAETAIITHRAFLADVATRTGLSLRQGIIEARAHTALLTPTLAHALAHDNLTAEVGQEALFVPQFRLTAAFPLLSAAEQISLLFSPAVGENLLLDLVGATKPLTEAEFERLLSDAVQRSDEPSQYKLLAIADRTSTPVSTAARVHLRTLLQSGSQRVRTQVLALIAALDDKDLVEAVVQSGWSSSASNDSHELWYGSAVLVEAAVGAVLPHQDAVARIAHSYYGRAAIRVGLDARREISRRIEASIRSAADLPVDFNGPDIELPNRGARSRDLTLFELHEPEPASSDVFAGLQRMSESLEAYAERRRRLEASFISFKEELTRQRASIVLDNLQIEEFDVIVAADPTRAASWYTLLTQLASNRLAPVHNIGLLLAHALAANDPEKAVELFATFRRSKPFVRLTFGKAGVTLDQMTLWSAADSALLNSIRFARLDEAASDHELATEVSAALWNHKEALLRDYIQTKLSANRPSEVARAIMVAGFSECSDYNASILEHHKDSKGFLGTACRTAHYSYERNKWAMHWFRSMCEAESGEVFWCSATLFRRIADGRFDVWEWPAWDDCSPAFRLFWPSVERTLKHRMERWKSLREPKLFGSPAPAKAFLAPPEDH